MPRADYEEIKNKFGEYIRTWMDRRKERLDELITEAVKVSFSIAQTEDSEEYKGLAGIRKFIETFPKTDVFHPAIYNFVCRIHEGEAQQYAQIPCVALNYVDGQEKMDSFYFTVMSCNHWHKEEDGWKMDSMKMDLEVHYGNLKDYFAETWYFGDPVAHDTENTRVPCIQGEVDSPWLVIPEAEDVLTEAEKVMENGAFYSFGVDHIYFQHSIDSFADQFGVYARYGEREGIQDLMSERKYKRQKDRYWVHPVRYRQIRIDGDWCCTTFYRVTGYKQRNKEYVFTRENADTEHMCQLCYKELVKEDGRWKTAYERFDLGLYEVGNYTEQLYGDSLVCIE